MIFDLYNITSNDRDHFGRMEAHDIDHAEKMVKSEFFDPKYLDILETEFIDQDEIIIGSYADLDPESDLDSYDYDQESEYSGIQIILSDDQESREFKTIFGENNFYTEKNGIISKPFDQYTMLQNAQKLGKLLNE